MSNDRQRYHRHRFPPEIISHAVWLYHRFCLSFRDVEDLLAERGVTVSYETIRHWCRKVGTEYARTWNGSILQPIAPRLEGGCMALSAGTRLGPYEILEPLGASEQPTPS